VALFEDFQEIMSCGGVEGFETPVVENEELYAAEGTEDSSITAIAARQCQIGE